RLPRADVLDRIGQVGGVTVTWLLHGTDETPVPPRGTPQPRQPSSFAADPVADALSRRLASRVRQLPRKYRERYEQRAGERAARIGRELEEYVELLRAEHLARRKRK